MASILERLQVVGLSACKGYSRDSRLFLYRSSVPSLEHSSMLVADCLHMKSLNHTSYLDPCCSAL